MALEKEHILLIEKYIARSLSAEEQKQLDLYRLNDEFAEELQFQEDLVRAVRSQERDELKSGLRTIEKTFSSKTDVGSKRNLRRIMMWSSAAVSLLVLLFYFLLPRNADQQGAALFAEFYEPFPNSIAPLTKGDESEINAYQAYELKNYEQAIQLFALEAETESRQFYLGLSHLGNEDIEMAEQLLLELADRQNDYQVPAKWYLALLQVKSSDYEEARILLREISVSNHPLKKTASRLLTRIS